MLFGNRGGNFPQMFKFTLIVYIIGRTCIQKLYIIFGKIRFIAVITDSHDAGF